MASTYNDDPANSDRDAVRYLIGDTVATMEFNDAEVDWELSEQSNVYLCAANMLSGLATRWAAKGKGVAEKQVSKLRIRYGVGGGRLALDARIAELRHRGTTTPRVFRAVGGPAA